MKLLSIMAGAVAACAAAYADVIDECGHSASESARRMMEENPLLAQHPGARVRFVLDKGRKDDGYSVVRKGDEYVIKGARPRSFLYAAGEMSRWIDAKDVYERAPHFKVRMLSYTGKRHSLADWIAATGANVIQLGRRAPVRWVKMCEEADVPAYAFLYGCDPMKWNRAKCEEFLAAHPSARGTDPGRSWEKGIMCPSDKYTWEFCASVIREIADAADYEGVAVTFWDDYGLNCHCKRCRKNGMDRFPAQVAALVKCFEEALKPTGKKLLVRTWASGCPHFLVGEWVHAPGYGGSSMPPHEMWDETFAKADKNTIIQTKVYNSDCQPNAPFSMLLGAARKAGLTEYAEWQITGQTVGLGFLPASVVNHTAWTMRKARELVGDAGVCLYAGGYNNPDYEALDDIMNSINIHAWRQLSWDPGDDIDAIWMEWARAIYGEAAAEAVAALKESERASVVSFSPLGLGAPTESRFTSNIPRREDLYRYTNRYYLPEGLSALSPTKESTARVVAEKDEALECVRRMEEHIAAAGEGPWKEELAVRTKWLKTHLLCTKALDGAMWRYRYLKYLCLVARTDEEVMNEIDADFDAIRANHKKLFEHEPTLKLSFYDKPCGDLEISLRSPVPLMRDIHSNAVECVEKIIGPRR